ncbi:hypothetical protein WJX72_010624 [[Myrmecia] bisecta]|uniref:AAA+ ATPase domain-containing protein n=1 Tax=[Myrmecia] bisecta TaxID=41462 RepID=A0AAW1Q325_9CHLO
MPGLPLLRRPLLSEASDMVEAKRVILPLFWKLTVDDCVNLRRFLNDQPELQLECGTEEKAARQLYLQGRPDPRFDLRGKQQTLEHLTQAAGFSPKELDSRRIYYINCTPGSTQAITTQIQACASPQARAPKLLILDNVDGFVDDISNALRALRVPLSETGNHLLVTGSRPNQQWEALVGEEARLLKMSPLSPELATSILCKKAFTHDLYLRAHPLVQEVVRRYHEEPRKLLKAAEYLKEHGVAGNVAKVIAHIDAFITPAPRPRIFSFWHEHKADAAGPSGV